MIKKAKGLVFNYFGETQTNFWFLNYLLNGKLYCVQLATKLTLVDIANSFYKP